MTESPPVVEATSDEPEVIELDSGAVIGYLPAGYRPDGVAHTARVVE